MLKQAIKNMEPLTAFHNSPPPPVNPHLKSLFLILIFTFIASGIALVLLQQIQVYNRQQIYLATEAALPVHRAPKLGGNDGGVGALKTYQDPYGGFIFQYPDNLKIANVGGRVELSHSIPYKNFGSCDMSPTAQEQGFLDDFKMSIFITEKNVAAAVKQESTYMPAENFTADSLKISPGFIDEYQVGNLKGFMILEGAEGCGNIIYYFPLESNKTLIVKKDIVQAFTGISTMWNMQEILKVPGVITPQKSEMIFTGILESFLPGLPTDPPCGQAITKAKNTRTGEVRDFPSTCLPEDWQPVR